MTWVLGQSAPSASSQTIRNWGAADTPDGCAASQMDLDRLENWTQTNPSKFDNRKRKVLHLGRNSPRHPYMLGPGKQLYREGSRSPGGQANHEPAMHPSQQRKPTASCTALGRALPMGHCQQHCPEGLWSLHLWRYSKPDWKWS